MALLTNQRCGSTNVMESFRWFWFVSIHCTTKRDRSRVGILRVPTINDRKRAEEKLQLENAVSP